MGSHSCIELYRARQFEIKGNKLMTPLVKNLYVINANSPTKRLIAASR
jgi:hypothetical protein